MKKHRLLATSIFLALNLTAVAGWHTNAPFIAWPATNHLRWVNGYTNAPVWTNSAYGGWTNNYVATNLWTWINWIGANGNAPFYWDQYGGHTPVSTGMFFNATDTRITDCALAALERWIAARKDVNVFGSILFDPDTFESWEMFYRNETRSLYGIKRVVAAMAGDYYHLTTNGPTAWDTTALSVAAGGPSNFLAVTAGMTRGGGRYYTPILTNTWVLATTNSGIATNTFIDSWGIAHVFAGTNGQAFSAIVTNATIQPGTTMDDYLSWDTLKAVITNLTMTKNAMTWTNNGVANTRVGVMPTSNAVYTIYQPYTPAMDQVEMSISNAVTDALADYAGGLRLVTNSTDRPYQYSLVNLLPTSPSQWYFYGNTRLESLKNFGCVSVSAISIPISKTIYAAKIGGFTPPYVFDGFWVTGVVNGAWVTVTNSTLTVATNGAVVVAETTLPPTHNSLTIDYTFYRYDDQYYYWAYPSPDFSNNRRGWKVVDESALLEWQFEYR